MSALQLPETTASSWIPVSGPAVANLQDFDSSDNNEAPLRGRKEEQILGQVQFNLGKSLTRNRSKPPDLQTECKATRAGVSGPTGAQDPYHDHFLEYSIESFLHFVQERLEETISSDLKMLLYVHTNINDFVFEMNLG